MVLKHRKPKFWSNWPITSVDKRKMNAFPGLKKVKQLLLEKVLFWSLKIPSGSILRDFIM